jgi:hypothetical protein
MHDVLELRMSSHGPQPFDTTRRAQRRAVIYQFLIP